MTLSLFAALFISCLTLTFVMQEPFSRWVASIICFRGHTEVQRLSGDGGVGRVADTDP